MASEGVSPDARCYRFAAEAFREAGEGGKSSPDVERYVGLAEDVDAATARRNSKDNKNDGERDRSGSVDVEDVLVGIVQRERR